MDAQTQVVSAHKIHYGTHDLNQPVFENDMPMIPPGRKIAGRINWVKVAEMARERPGERLMIAYNVSTRGHASNINAGRVKHLPIGEFKATSEKTRHGAGFDIYVEYVGW